MLLLTTCYFKDKERGTDVYAGTLLEYTDTERANALIQSGVAVEAQITKIVTEKDKAESEIKGNPTNQGDQGDGEDV
jgi:hypothetical protein